MTPDKDEELKRQQLRALINLYEHHLDLFWKWITLYVTIVTGLSAFIFNKDISITTKRLFPILIAIASLGVALGCAIMWSWLKEFEREVTRISSELMSSRYPSFLGIRMTVAAFIIAVIFALGNLIYAKFGLFG
jgi:ribose/xylose/arabinose/galactoside ABC-type transport system permease subunit